MTTAEAHAEELKAAKEEAEVACAQARQKLRRLSSTGAANPNFPAGVQRGTINKSLNPPLFRTVRVFIHRQVNAAKACASAASCVAW